jgi:hypothetical protein
MKISTNIRNKRKNLLLRYKNIIEEFDKYNALDIPITVIHRKYIYPKFFISRNTLYKIFNIQIDEELKKLGVNTEKEL